MGESEHHVVRFAGFDVRVARAPVDHTSAIAGASSTEPPLWNVQRTAPVFASMATIIPKNDLAYTTPFATLTAPIPTGQSFAPRRTESRQSRPASVPP